MTPKRRRELEAREIAKRNARPAEPGPLTGYRRGIRAESNDPLSRKMHEVTSPWCGVLGVQVRRKP
jgi:hypothetical protein